MTAIVIEMRAAIILLAGERGWGETRERWLERAARKAGVSYRTAKSFFYSELRDPKTSIVTQVRHAVEKISAIQEDSARDEFLRLEARLRMVEARLDAIDPNYHRTILDAVGADADGTGGDGSSVDNNK